MLSARAAAEEDLGRALPGSLDAVLAAEDTSGLGGLAGWWEEDPRARRGRWAEWLRLLADNPAAQDATPRGLSCSDPELGSRCAAHRSLSWLSPAGRGCGSARRARPAACADTDRSAASVPVRSRCTTANCCSNVSTLRSKALFSRFSVSILTWVWSRATMSLGTGRGLRKATESCPRRSTMVSSSCRIFRACSFISALLLPSDISRALNSVMRLFF
mmetsp:Transcript_9581/g.24485  ORF Transcript_9581/g.24485 Transcript_9581/m.24485 type:complete len:217 (+) Transcript_9581:505-1155(+)